MHASEPIGNALFCVIYWLEDYYKLYWYSFTLTGVQHDFHIRWCSCRLTITRRVSIVDQELITCVHRFVDSSCCTICNFVSSVLSIIVCLFSLFCWSLYYLSTPVVSNLNLLSQTSFHFKTCLPFKSFLRLCVSYLLQWPVQYCLFSN